LSARGQIVDILFIFIGAIMLLHVTKDNFEKEVLQSDKPVLVDFWASWCRPCRMVGPVIEELAEELTDITVGKVNVDEEGAIAEKYGIMSIPTLMLFKNGSVAKREAGAMPKDKILEFITT
jgi:thioredoxin 1